MVRLTDHALVRWLERSGALDVEHIRAAIEASLDRATKAAVAIGAQRYLIVADGLVYIVRGEKVVTVLEDTTAYQLARQLDRDE